MIGGVTRRKFIVISGAAAGFALAPFGTSRKAADNLVEWSGMSLGAAATIRINHPDSTVARRLIANVVREAQQLEAVLSLYQPESSLCELNRRKVLVAPPAALIDVLTLCDEAWRITRGMFDPTVQPLWQCYVDHFSRSGPASPGPSVDQKAKAIELVGWQKLGFDRNGIVFERRGMGLTLNGIAQGYITDRVVERLRNGGIENCLVDMGEIRGIGKRPDGQPWEVALENGPGKIEEERPERLLNKAIATSSATGFQFDAKGHCNHLFDPRNGICASPARTLSVTADTAAKADALSTAFSLMSEREIRAVVQALNDVEVRIGGWTASTRNAERT
jgi:thiamine biosynthesis lipoprotein